MKILLFILLTLHTLYANIPTYHYPRSSNTYDINSIDHLILGAKKGDPIMQYRLASRYRDGEGVVLDFKKAFNLFHRSALKKFAPAQYQLGMMFRHGVGVKTNHELARYWLRKSAQNAYPKAKNIFYHFYSQKERSPQY
jgi:TPR repeat protein